MNFEPQKFFIGLIDFFSIILPGALLTWFVGKGLACWLQDNGDYDSRLTDYGLAAFLFSSYLLGHFVFLVGSWFLDNAYDRIREATFDKQVKLLAEGKATSPCWLRGLAWCLFKKDVDKPVDSAVRIKEHYLGPLCASSAVNAFQWSKARLTLDASAAIAGVQRFEADSKFFRSLVVVLMILIPWGLLTSPARPSVALASVPLLILALWRYADQRIKSTNQAYWYVIAMEAACEKGFRVQSPKDSLDRPTHAGGVVFRRAASGSVEYLLVQATHDPNDWVLPKGHIERDERPAHSAVREVKEETGVWASIRGNLGQVSYTAMGEPVRAEFYVMEALATGKPVDRNRKVEWLSLKEALAKIRHEEIQVLLAMADRVASRTRIR